MRRVSGIGSRVAGIGLLVAGAAQAQDTARTAPTNVAGMVVTASRRPELESGAATATTVISREDIRLSAASDVAAVLAVRAGIQPAEGTPAGAGIMLQGLGDQRVLILLDGQPLAGRIGGGFDLSRIPVSSVERIEIVQGPQSLFYGSDALGGVVNIITRDPRSLARSAEGIVTEAEIIGGSHERLDLSTRLSRSSGNFAATVAGGRRMQALAPGISRDVGTRADRWDIAPRAVLMHGDALTLDASGLAIVENQRYRTGQLYTFSDNVQYAASTSAKWDFPGRTISTGLSLSSFDHLSRASTTDRPASDSGARDVQRIAKADLGFSASAASVLVDGGAELRREWTSADRIAGGSRAVNGAATFGQATWSLGAFSVIPGARMSWSETWGAAVTPRLALLARPSVGSGSLTLRAAVASGFRAPDFKELYLDFVNAAAGYAVRGNPDLRPERSVNVNAGADWRRGGATLKANVYRNRFRGFIETVGPDDAGTFTYANIARGSSAGVDVDGTQRIGVATASAGYSYLHTRNDADAGPLLGRAAHTARAAVAFRPKWSTLSLSTVYTGSAPSARDENGNISAYREALTQVNARIARSLGRAVSGGEVFFAVDNILDDSAGAEWPGFTGRRMSAGLSWTFR
jgi:outer membrane receptor for ferrienterochelin and colicins